MLFPEAEVTKSLSNLLKGFNTRLTEDRVIDYNEIISNKIESFKSRMNHENVSSDGFVSGLNASVVENLISDDAGNQENNDSFDDLTDALVNTDNTAQNNEELERAAGEIIEDANKKAQDIIEDAKSQAEKITKEAYDKAFEDGKSKGYEEGAAKADAEYQTLINDANSELARLEQEYKTRYNSMESEIVSTLLEVFSKVTYTIAEDNKEIVLHLINGVMNNIEATGDFLIRVSKEDYQFLVENQGKIYCASPKDINISIIEDSSMLKNQCIIETDGGVFDCSLDIQLEQLSKDIKLLSCM